MPRLLVERVAMAHPGDVSGIAALFDSGRLAPAMLRAVIGKTEGNGGLNDFTRGYFIQSLMHLLAARTGEAPDALAARIPCMLSGGTEGVLSPHAVLLAEAPATATGPGLALATGFGPRLPAEAIGTGVQIAAVAATVRRAMEASGIADPALVFVKTPAGSLGAMARARAAAALGAARALGDVPAERATEAALLRDLGLYSNRVAISAGIEVPCDEVILLGQAPGWAPGLVLGVRPMRDVLDLAAVQGLVAALGGPARLRAVFAKGEPDAAGRIRGQRHTMLGDTDIDAQRHLRAALGAVVAAVAGDGRVFVSGGAEHQGPPGGGLVAAIAEAAA
jgi:cyanuric acid amidohydrolase